MPSEKIQTYSPLSRSSSEEINDFRAERIAEKQQERQRLWVSRILIGILVVTNVITVGLMFRDGTSEHIQNEANYLGESDNAEAVLVSQHWNTEFSMENKTQANKLWGSLFPAGAGLVSVPKTWAREHRLPETKENPSNSSHAVYFTAVFHQLHCLTVVRASLHHFQESKEQTVPWIHVTHCLDSLRQALMCSRDETLLYTEDGSIYGDGQIHECQQWESLYTWVGEHRYEDLK